MWSPSQDPKGRVGSALLSVVSLLESQPQVVRTLRKSHGEDPGVRNPGLLQTASAVMSGECMLHLGSGSLVQTSGDF